MNNEVLNSAKLGNASALNQLLIASERYAKSVIRSFLGNKYAAKLDVEDVSQIVLAQVARDVATCSAQDWASYLGWLSFVCRNTTYKEVEKLQALKRKADSAPSNSEDRPDIAGNTSTPDEYMIAEETRAQLLKLAAGVNEHGEYVLNGMLGGQSSSEIASELGVDVSLVYLTTRRIKERVQSALA